MNDVVRTDILSVVAATIEALQQGNYGELGGISNRTTHNATIYQDEDSLGIAIVVYAISKVVLRCGEHDKVCPDFVPRLRDLDKALAQKDDVAYRSSFKLLLADIKGADDKLHLYIDDVLRKARLKKAAKLHEHGISVSRAAEMLGISHWEMLSYIGKTNIPDDAPADDAARRLDIARKIFR